MSSFDKPVKYLSNWLPPTSPRFFFPVQRPFCGDRLLGRNNEHAKVDDCYIVESNGSLWTLHLEYHRRHQARAAMALDLGEAQFP